MQRLIGRGPLLLALSACVALAACGGSPGEESSPKPSVVPGSLQERLDRQAGENVGLILGTSDLAIGENRVSFLVVGNNGQVVEADSGTVYVAPTLNDRPTQTAPAKRRLLDPHGSGKHTQKHAEPDTEALFVTRLRFEEPGRYWFVVDLAGSPTQGFFAIDVKEHPAAPAVGDRAIASENPTIGDAPLAQLTTARPPDRALLRSSINEALAANVPFVVVFATPRYCTSRTCGPTVEIVEEVRRRVSPSPVRFIHIEVYEDNDPANGVNRWMKEWKLPSEPWIFVVDQMGIISERFEGSASVEELEAAVRKLL